MTVLIVWWIINSKLNRESFAHAAVKCLKVISPNGIRKVVEKENHEN